MRVKTITTGRLIAVVGVAAAVAVAGLLLVAPPARQNAIAGIDPSPFTPHRHVGLLACEVKPDPVGPVVSFVQAAGVGTRAPLPAAGDACAGALAALSDAGLLPSFLTPFGAAMRATNGTRATNGAAAPDTLIWELLVITRDREAEIFPRSKK